MPENNGEPESDIRMYWQGCKEITKGIGVLAGYFGCGQILTDVLDSHAHLANDALNNRLGAAAISTVVMCAAAAVTLRPVARM